MKESFLQSEQAWSDTVHARPRSNPRRRVEPHKLLPIVAEHPDAAPQRSDTLLRMILHALLLVAISAFLAYCCLWLPFGRSIPATFAPSHTTEATVDIPRPGEQTY